MKFGNVSLNENVVCLETECAKVELKIGIEKGPTKKHK